MDSLCQVYYLPCLWLLKEKLGISLWFPVSAMYIMADLLVPAGTSSCHSMFVFEFPLCLQVLASLNSSSYFLLSSKL